MVERSPFFFPEERRPMNFSGFVPKGNRRLSGIELLLDNILGIDNQYETVGERLGTALREDPVAVAQAVGSGLKDTVSTLRGGISGTPSEFIRDIVEGTKDMFRPMDQRLIDEYGEYATEITPEQYNRVAEGRVGDAVSLGTAFVPTALATRTLASRGLGSLDSALDPKFRAQAERRVSELSRLENLRPDQIEENLAAISRKEVMEPETFLQNRPLFTQRSIKKEFAPSSVSEFARLQEAQYMLDRMSDPSDLFTTIYDIQDKTGLLPYPIRDAAGNVDEIRFVETFLTEDIQVSPSAIDLGKRAVKDKKSISQQLVSFLDLKDDPESISLANDLDDYKLTFKDLSKKEKAFAGYHNPSRREIVVNTANPKIKESLASNGGYVNDVIAHELDHVLATRAFKGERGLSGSNPDRLYTYKKNRVAELRSEIKDIERGSMSEGEKAARLNAAKSELSALLGTTSFAEYRKNPGEIMAGFAMSSGPVLEVPLKGTEVMNPYLNPERKNLLSGIPGAVRSSLLPENRAMAIDRALEKVGLTRKDENLMQAFSPESNITDFPSIGVPIDFSDARIMERPVRVDLGGVSDEIPFAVGGRISGLGSLGMEYLP